MMLDFIIQKLHPMSERRGSFEENENSYTKNCRSINVLNKYESESDEKEKKFWDDIAELKIPLGDIFEDSN